MNKVEIVCNCCGDRGGTAEFIERMSRTLNATTDDIHEALYAGKKDGVKYRWVFEGKSMILEGCHAVPARD